MAARQFGRPLFGGSRAYATEAAGRPAGAEALQGGELGG
jgi:hypothetical protein